MYCYPSHYNNYHRFKEGEKMKETIVPIIYNSLKQRLNCAFNVLPKPISVGFVVTYMCNSKCKLCNIWKKYKEEPDLRSKELDLEQIRNIFVYNRDFLKNVRGVLIGGGEPFLRRDLSMIIKIIHENMPKAKIGIATNGLNPKSIIKVVENITEFVPIVISVSIDGLNETNDNLRGKKGAFKQAIGLIEELSTHNNVDLGISFTISPQNYKELIDVYELSKSLDVFFTCRSVHLSEFYSNIENRYEFNENSIEEIKKMILYICADLYHHKSFSYASFYSFFFSNIPSYIIQPHKMIIPCYSGSYSFVLDPYGDVFSCLFIDKKLGNLTKQSLKEIWSSEDAWAIRKEIEKGKCPNCWTECEISKNIKFDLFNLVKWSIKYYIKTKRSMI